MNKAAIKTFAVWARNKLIADIVYKAGLIGITDKGIAPGLPQSTKEVQFFDIGTRDYATVRGEEIRQRDAFVAAIREKEREVGYADAFQFIVEKVAYTWFNRLIAIRFMEVNDYLPSRVRVLSSDLPNKTEPDMVTKPFDLDLDFSAEDHDEIMQLKDENRLDELFRKLFLMQCYKLNEILPRLFDKDPRKTSDRSRSYFDLLLTISFTDQDGVVCHLVNDIKEQDFRILTAEDLERQKIENIPDEEMPAGQVAIIGWMYQYYNTEPKDQVFAGLKKNIKISKDKIPAATQLFTPDWIVRYMVENSLGRLWLEGHPEAAKFLPDKNADGSVRVEEGRWNYYLEEAEQEPVVQAQLAEIRKENAALRPEDLKVIDPCMGSGHILVYLFDVLMQIYDSQGWTKREAVRSILENNLYGLDIDERAAQLAYFAVMMKARQYDRRFLSRGMEPHVYEIQESGYTDVKGKTVHHITEDLIDYFANGNKALKRDIAAIAEDLFDAKEYGSLLNVRMADFPALYARFEEIREDISLYQMPALEILLPLVQRAEAMAQKYHAVVTNPPYMGGSGMGSALSKFIKDTYPDYKSDTFSAFMVRCSAMAKSTGYCGFFTPYVWMFIKSYEQLRGYLYHRCTIETLIQFEYSAFAEATVPVCTFVFGNTHFKGKKGGYFRLTDFRGGMEVQRQKTLEAINNHKCGYYYEQVSDSFSIIPGAPVAYWMSSKLRETFETGTPLGSIAAPRKGNSTSDNNRFLRIWYEVEQSKMNLCSKEITVEDSIRRRWYPYNKGGGYRKWYGYNEFLIDWYNDAYEIRHIKTAVIANYQYFMKPGLTWSTVTSDKFSIRWFDEGFIFDNGGCCIFELGNNRPYLMALLNSSVFHYIFGQLNPTLNFQSGEVAKFPVLFCDQSNINMVAINNVSLSKSDWDSFETSWDFQCHPLVRWSTCLQDATSIGSTIHAYYGKHVPASCPLELCYLLWQGECNQRFNQLKANEEELNRIFIDLYGLQDELTPEVEDRDVTVRKADLQRDIRSLISYAVGCMFGRYSLDVDGLAYAGGAWDAGKYTSFQPDPDNCIPITDEAYFEDDIVGRFVEFIRVVYGADTLNENLAFIAKALGNKGNSSREVIRNYFLKDFFKDHCKIYQKRPIYWLFDSGKQNGFKALVYLHRWNADTVGNLRVEYLHRVQKVYEREIQRMQDTMDNSRNNREVNQAAKRREKLVKQLKEARDYDARIAHVALSRVDIDLDDGVKVNYQKVQQGPDGKSLGILAKI